MKLIIAIVHERDKHKLADSLLQNGLTFTKLGSTGGFLRQGNVTLLLGVEDADVEATLGLLQEACGVSEGFVNLPGEAAVGAAAIGAFAQHPVRVESGGGVAWVLDVEGFTRF